MSVVAIVVIYKCKINESNTIKSLLYSCEKYPEPFNNFRLIIYDNSPDQQIDLPRTSFESIYKHDPENHGLAVAYNYALNNIAVNDDDWLFLLDQDSILPIDFVEKLNADICTVQNNELVAAVVPKIKHGDSFFSPSRILYGGTMRPINMQSHGIYHDNIFAIGSGTAVRATFVRHIKGFNEFFWMDCLDRWLFNAIERENSKVFVSNSVIQHELSVMDYDNLLNEKRYINIMLYETCFMRLYKTKMENIVYYFRLLKRTIFLGITVKNKRYAKLTFHHLFQNVFNRTTQIQDILGAVNKD